MIRKFLLLALGGWCLSWLSVGISAGSPLLVLQPNAPEPHHTIYLVLLYLSLLIATYLSWGPDWLNWERPSQLLIWMGLGVGLGVVHRLVLTVGGYWGPPSAFPEITFLTVQLLLALVVGLSEELVFRGVIFGGSYLPEQPWKAHLGTACFFAAVHLFRPGGLHFKLSYGLGLLLFSLLLSTLVVYHKCLWGAAGLHAGVVYMNMVDPPSRMVGSWWSGLNGELVAGVLGWILTILGIWTLKGFYRPKD